jgi:hypothetical protein
MLILKIETNTAKFVCFQRSYKRYNENNHLHLSVKGTVSRDISGNFMTWMDISTLGEEPLLVF